MHSIATTHDDTDNAHPAAHAESAATFPVNVAIPLQTSSSATLASATTTRLDASFQPRGQRGIAWEHLLLLTVLAMCVIVARRPDALFNPQFWAEDGVFWFADAYNLGGFHALLTPHTGYYQTDARLVGWAATYAPLLYAPLLFNLVAIVAQAAPVTLLLSSRYDMLIPDRRVRWLLVALYLALPNSAETNVNITNMQWRLALVTLLIVLGTPSTTRTWRLIDGCVVALGGLSGPFCAPLLVVLLARCWQTRSRWLAALTGVTLATLAIQASAALTTPRGAFAPNDASLALGLRIIASQVIVGLLAGQAEYARIQHAWWWQGGWAPVIVVLLAAAPLLWALARAPLELRLFLLYAAIVLGLGLASPVVSDTLPQWRAMTLPGIGQRYYLFPLLAFGATLVWLLTQHIAWRTVATLALLCVALVAAPHDWSYPAYTNLHWSSSVARFDAAAPGSLVTLPINPPGWSLQLLKHGGARP